MKRLNALTAGSARNVTRCPYRPGEYGIGIVHLGLGAFHRAHQAWYTHNALGLQGGDWRIASVSFRSSEMAETLMVQDGLFTLEECDAKGRRLSIIGSVAKALSLKKARQKVLDLVSAETTKIITITATEKAYCLEPSHSVIDENHPAIQNDMQHLEVSTSLPGFIVHALQKRRDAGLGGVAILSCDNIPQNGKATRAAILGVARLCDAQLAGWIDENCTFPSSMVDRITPAVTEDVLDNIESQLGLIDRAALRTERFSQWVIEDCFPFGRPDWDAAGATLVNDVTPFEKMKLRMLNGTHSLLAYTGHLAGKPTIESCMDDPKFRSLARCHMATAASSLMPPSDADFNDYADDLIARFENPGIIHETYQIAMDGSQKMPPRIFSPAVELCGRNKGGGSMAFATAAWLKYTLGFTDAGRRYALRDPREEELRKTFGPCTTAQEVYTAALSLDGLIPQPLAINAEWRRRVIEILNSLFEQGAAKTVENYIQYDRV